MVFRFGDFEADEERFELRRSGRPLALQPRVLDVIFALARADGRLITKEDLIAGPWNGIAVSDGALNQAIMLARRALASHGKSRGRAADRKESAIVTVRGRGFRFVADVTVLAERQAPPPPLPGHDQRKAEAQGETEVEARPSSTIADSIAGGTRQNAVASRDEPTADLPASSPAIDRFLPTALG